MSENIENPEKTSGSLEPVLADSRELGMNDSGTCAESDTPLTQPRSPAVRRTGHVYFIRAGEHIKIGYSGQPLDRLKALQVSHAGKLEIVGTLRGSPYHEGTTAVSNGTREGAAK